MTRLLAVEPSLLARKSASKRIAEVPFPVEWVGTEGQSLSLQDRTVGQVLSTLTLCTIATLAFVSPGYGLTLFFRGGDPHTPPPRPRDWLKHFAAIVALGSLGGAFAWRRVSHEQPGK